MKVDTILNHLEKIVNWSLKEDKFVEIPEELHSVELEPLWMELQEAGYTIEFSEDGYSFKVIKQGE